jgi:hypothetical protein
MFESVTKAILAHKHIVIAAVALAGVGIWMVPAPAQAQFIGLFDYNPQINSNTVDQDADQKVKGDSASGSITQNADTTQSNSHTGGTVNITLG